MKEKISLLQQISLFSQFEKEELEVIARYSEYRSYDEGETIFSEGDDTEGLFVVVGGQVLITKQDESDRQRDVARFLTGESFGELSLFERASRTATAVAEIKSNLLVFPLAGVTFASILEQHAYISAQMLHKLLAIISNRIRQTNSLISEKTEWIEELRKQILNDKLTGLYNRTFLEEDFRNQLSQYGEVSSLIAIKPDNFKLINDTYGHDAGDRILRVLADTVKSNINETDIAVRYRGDEFMVIFPDQGREVIIGGVNRLKEALSGIDTAKVTGGKGVPITMSIGLVEYPGDADSSEPLISKAHEKMWEAREAGGDRILA